MRAVITNKKWKKYYTIALVLLPILNQYVVAGVRIIEMFAIIGFFVYIMENGKIVLNSKYDYFVVYGLIVSVGMTAIQFFTIPQYNLPLMNYFFRLCKFIIVFVGIIVASRKYFDYDLGRKWYGHSVVFCSLILIFQYLVHFMTGEALFGILPGTILNYENEMAADYFIAYSYNRLNIGFPYRPCSVFVEPAHYAVYVLPWLFLEVNKPQMKNSKVFVVLVTFAVFLSSSSLGIVGGVVAWGTLLIGYVKRHKLTRRVLVYIPITLILIVGIISVLLQSEGFLFSVRTKLESLGNLSEASSLTYRLFRGMLFYAEIGVLYKAFGLGYGNLDAYYHATNMRLSIDNNLVQVAYMNGIQEILNMYGLVGLFLFVAWLYYCYKKSFDSKMLVLAFLAILFGSDYYDTASYTVVVVLLLTSHNIISNKVVVNKD